jgi:hypothetical protein
MKVPATVGCQRAGCHSFFQDVEKCMTETTIVPMTVGTICIGCPPPVPPRPRGLSGLCVPRESLRMTRIGARKDERPMEKRSLQLATIKSPRVPPSRGDPKWSRGGNTPDQRRDEAVGGCTNSAASDSK